MRKKKIFLPILFVFIFISGCWTVDSDFKKMRREIFRSAGLNDIEREVEISIGRLDLYLAEKLVSLDVNKEELEIILSNVSNIQVGVYNYKFQQKYHKEIPELLDKPMYRKGWSRLLVNRSKDELNLVYINTSGQDKVNQMIFLAMEDDEIVFVTMEGRLDKIISKIIRNRGLQS